MMTDPPTCTRSSPSCWSTENNRSWRASKASGRCEMPFSGSMAVVRSVITLMWRGRLGNSARAARTSPGLTSRR